MLKDSCVFKITRDKSPIIKQQEPIGEDIIQMQKIKKIKNDEKLNSIFNFEYNFEENQLNNIQNSRIKVEDAGNYVCFYSNCNKEYKTFCSWKLHYLSHDVI